MILCATCKKDITSKTQYHYNYGEGPYCALCAPQNRDKERVTCRFCNAVEVLVWDDDMNAQLRYRTACFTCNHFLVLHEKYSHESIRINHVHYLASKEPSPNTHRVLLGHGGREFTIVMKDGTQFTTHNLWCQGDIPSHLHTLLPDNAEWANP